MDLLLENGYYASFLGYFKNEHGDERDFLLKQYKEVISGNDVKELQLVFETVLTLKNNYLQSKDTTNDKILLASWQYLYKLFIDHINSVEYNNDIKYFDPIKSSVICVDILDPQLKKKLSKNDLDNLLEKLSIPINDSNALHIKSYVDDIPNWYTGLNTALLCNNSKKSKISSNCSHEEKIQCEIYQTILNHIGEITSTRSTQRKCLYKLFGLNKKKSTIGCHCDLILCDQYDYVHLVGEVSEPPSKKLSNKERFDLEKTIETSVLDHMMQQIYCSRLLNWAKIFLNKKIMDKVDFLQFLFTVYELIVAIAKNANKMDKLMNKLSRKKQEWKANNINTDFDFLTISDAEKKLVLLQAITLSTPSSSLLSDDAPNSLKASIHVFAIDIILHTSEHLTIYADNDDLIPNIKI
ncbi:1539_t:CDS:2 [Cetraspora pellucida]|uniref:1539_t:CDS:1 n=1 Tax=Cetraspora pellucida TaxID=1433469 RepID=A0A9N9NEN2_9GLOM|nr:1539_t:CDS:2 [Cetraspora pellucida]